MMDHISVLYFALRKSKSTEDNMEKVKTTIIWKIYALERSAVLLIDTLG